MANLDAFGQAPALEQDALRAIAAEDYMIFERRVVQLKALYQNNAKLVPSESTYKSLALYLLYLLASDRIADFHTLLESLSTHEQANQYVRYPVQLERYIMEGNYAKVLAEKRDPVFETLSQRLTGVVLAKQQETRAESASTAGMVTGSGLTMIDRTAALGVLSHMVGYATDLERIV